MKSVVAAIFVLGISCLSSKYQNAIELKEGDPFFSEMLQYSLTWQRAVSLRNVDTLVALTWPEYRLGTRQRLGDPKSALFQMLLRDGGMVRDVVDGAPPTGITVFQEAGSGPVTSFAICYSKLKGSRKWPNRFDEVLAVRNRDTFCSYWVKEPEGVFVSYTFALSRVD